MKRILSALVAGIGLTLSADAQPWHKMPTQNELQYRQQHPKSGVQFLKKGTTSTGEMPSDARFPGEYEEVQAVLVSWPYDWPVPNIDVTSSYADLWGQLTDAIQQEAKVLIRVDNWADSTPIKTFMTNRGTPLTNYQFYALVGDAWWTRDFGPLGFYYSQDDSVGFLDLHYYPGRDYDDAFAEYLGDQMNYKNVKTNLHAEGGNFMTDGFGNSFHSSVISNVNTYSPPTYPGWTAQQIKDSVKYYWASENVTVTQRLNCDGGTGHIDMYMKMMDEETFAIMEYPSVVTATDKNTILRMIDTIASRTSVYGRPYRIFRMPMPTRDDGTYRTTCNQITNDARTFVNGLTVNKTYIMPAYSNSNNGNASLDSTAIEMFKKIIPGYKIIPIDARDLTVLGGAIHCVTMQIPAENPVRFWHPAVRDLQPLQADYSLVAEVTNKSGVASATCFWRLEGQTSWNTVNLTDSSGYWIGKIPGANLTVNDKVEYYISATTNNGKTATKPITAPDGYFSFYFTLPQSTSTIDPDQNFVLNPAPNPSLGEFFLPLSLDQTREIRAVVTDMMGKVLQNTTFGKRQRGMSKLEFDLGAAAPGLYFVQILADGQHLSTKKVVKE